MGTESQSFPTLLGGPPAGPAPGTAGLPPEAHGAWRIEMRYLPLGHRGHAYLALVDPGGVIRDELHGRSYSRNTNRPVPIGVDGSRLMAESTDGLSRIREQSAKVSDVAAGTYDDIVRGKWARGLQTKHEINKRNLDYKADDVSYEIIGGDGGQIQNSNSAAYTFGKAMDLDLDSAIHDAGMGRRFPGWGRNLIDPDYKPYVAPPQFAFRDAP